MTQELIERLRDHARNVGGDPSYERLYGDEACEIADTIASLQARVAKLEGALRRIVDHDERRKVPGSQGYMIDVTSDDLQAIARTAIGKPNGQG